MRNRVEVVEALFGALQQQDIELAASLLDDQFELVGLTSGPLQKEQFLALHSELQAAMPDLSYNLEGVHRQEDRDHVEGTIQLRGTHTDELSLPLYTMRSLPATGIAMALPQTTIHVQVDNDLVVLLRADVIAGGGLNGILQQLGSELPLLPRNDRQAE